MVPEIETACFRIVQEALTNITRHADATWAAIDLHTYGGWLELTVRDDGFGFDVTEMRARASAGASLGMLGMEERATLVGGQLGIESTPGQGTLVKLRCPLQVRAEAQ
jgi:signal transduction histidine kinase